MRALHAALLLALAPVARAQDAPPEITLQVGEESARLGIMPRCDDLGVVAVTPDGRGVRGVRPGRTLCSFDRSGGGGARQVYLVVVVATESEDARRGAKPRDGG